MSTHKNVTKIALLFYYINLLIYLLFLSLLLKDKKKRRKKSKEKIFLRFLKSLSKMRQLKEISLSESFKLIKKKDWHTVVCNLILDFSKSAVF